jgi:hypothetical protein
MIFILFESSLDLFETSLQPIAETREKQLRLWKELILDYCAKSHIYQINPITFPYFKNESINRQLSSEGIAAVTQYLVNSSKQLPPLYD